jgi:hypothetical protein
MLIDTATTFSGGEGDVVEYPAESRSVVRLIGTMGIQSILKFKNSTFVLRKLRY